jgi:hypothetical protein
MNKLIIISALLALTCAPSSPRDLESAQRAAFSELRAIMFEGRVDIKLFQGPNLVIEDSGKYVFHWVSTVPGLEATICEVSVPKDPKGEPGIRIKGKRDRFGYLSGTLDFPLNESALYSLFRLPPDPKDTTSDRARRLRMVPLDEGQLKDVANFVSITSELHGYASCFDRRYPASLEELNNVTAKFPCGLDRLDSMYIHDRYGRKYYYENFIEFLVLGTPGENGKWDFNRAVLDSLYNDEREYILTNDDDLLVKIKPFR